MRRALVPLILVLLALPPSAQGRPSPRALAGALARADDLDSRIDVTRRVLARAGVATKGPSSAARRAATPPAPLAVTPLMSANLALGAHSPGMLSLADFGSFLAAAGAPLGRGSEPGNRLRRLLAGVLRRARDRPDASWAFTPLFLAESLRRRAPELRFARGDYDPDRLPLTGLEVHLLLAWFGRGLDTAGAAGTSQASAAPCRTLKRTLDALGHFEDLPRDLTREGWPDLFRFNRDLVETSFGKVAERWLRRFLLGLDVAATVKELHDLYKTANVRLETQPPLVRRRPEPGAIDPRRDAFFFVARGGVSERDYKTYLDRVARDEEADREFEKLRDCFAALKVQTPRTLTDMLDAVASSRMRWVLRELSPNSGFVQARGTGTSPTGLPGFEYPVRLEGRTLVSDYTADILPMRQPESATVKRVGRAVTTVELMTTTIPVDSLIALLGGIPKLVGDWWATFSPPRASREVNVIWFEAPCGGRGAIAAQSCRQTVPEYVMSFAGEHGFHTFSTSCDGPDSFYEETSRATHSHSASRPFLLRRSPSPLFGTVTTATTTRYTGSGEQTRVTTGDGMLWTGIRWDDAETVTLPYSGTFDVMLEDSWSLTRVPADLLGRDSFSVPITAETRRRMTCEHAAHDETVDEWVKGTITFTRR